MYKLTLVAFIPAKSAVLLSFRRLNNLRGAKEKLKDCSVDLRGFAESPRRRAILKILHCLPDFQCSRMAAWSTGFRTNGACARRCDASRVVALLGPRQCGKTTLARQFVDADSINYFDLEDPASLARLSQPDLALRPLRGLVVIDEIQRRAELFPLLRVLADRRPAPARFLILGSASPDLLRQSSETLAGRIETVPLEGFRLADLGSQFVGRHWLRGGMPLAYTARSDRDSLIWRRQFVQTFLEREVPMLGIHIPATALQRLWNMVAHYHGQIWNAAELARALGVNETTVRRYLDLLAGMFMVRQLPPWFENMRKRQVKSPKIYVRDSGLLHALWGIGRRREVELHPKIGASCVDGACGACDAQAPLIGARQNRRTRHAVALRNRRHWSRAVGCGRFPCHCRLRACASASIETARFPPPKLAQARPRAQRWRRP